MAKIKGRSKDVDGNVIGNNNDNPFLETMVYDVEFPDGAQIDPNGRSHIFLDYILDLKKYSTALSKDDMYITNKSGRRRIRQSTLVRKFLTRHKDRSEQWILIKILKEYNPIEVTGFFTVRGIADELAFSWQISYTLRRRDRIISAVNKRIKRMSHKYGVEVTTSIEHSYIIDKTNGNHLWRDVINREM